MQFGRHGRKPAFSINCSVLSRPPGHTRPRCFVPEATMGEKVLAWTIVSSAGISCIVCPDTFVPTSLSDYDGAALVVDSLEDLTLPKLEQLASEQSGT